MKSIALCAFVVAAIAMPSVSSAKPKAAKTFEECSALAASRGFSTSGRDRGTTNRFIKACQKGQVK